MSGQIIAQFCAFNSLAGRLVSFGTQGTVGHVSIVLLDGSLIDAQNENGLGGKPSGVQIRAASYIAECGGYNIVRATLSTTDEIAAAFYSYIYSKVGSLYDLHADIGIGLNEDWHTEGKFICSGLFMCGLTKPTPAFISKPLIKDPHIWSPEQALLLCNGFAEITPIV